MILKMQIKILFLFCLLVFLSNFVGLLNLYPDVLIHFLKFYANWFVENLLNTKDNFCRGSNRMKKMVPLIGYIFMDYVENLFLGEDKNEKNINGSISGFYICSGKCSS